MLRGNLSTRPFYNERLVTLVLALIGLAALALTAFNVSQVLSLSAERAVLRTQIEASNAEADRIRREADAVQQTIDRTTLASLRQSTREANDLIDERAFSWTVFFGYIERTLPIDVRLVSVQPRVDRGEFLLGMTVVSRRLADLQTFVNRLHDTGVFPNVFVASRDANDDGTFIAQIDTGYSPLAQPAHGEGDLR
jgi:hypothetical protein